MRGPPRNGVAELHEGDTAPDFTLKDDEGNGFTLSEELGKANVILYFYPKDDTPGCRAEAQAFRDEIKIFFGLDATIVGVSGGTVRAKADFKKRYQLNFRLLADEDREVTKRYGALGLLGLTPKRITFVIAKDGRIRRIYGSPLPNGHLVAARETLFQMREEEQKRHAPAASAAP
jgi:peroxiredoxin Q/BCP